MGKGGLDPVYFMTRMEWWEAQSYMDGLAMRERRVMASTRHLEFILVNMFGDKSKAPESEQDLYLLPWEQDQIEPIDEDAMQQLLDECAQANIQSAKQDNTKA